MFKDNFTMKIPISKAMLFFAMLLFPMVGQAQCAMCRAALQSSENGVQAQAVNDGIVYLMIIPYVLVGLIGFAVYKSRQKVGTKS